LRFLTKVSRSPFEKPVCKACRLFFGGHFVVYNLGSIEISVGELDEGV